jgi:hypothetical protein
MHLLNNKGKRSPLEKCDNVHSVAGLFKLFIRELPQSIFPEAVYEHLLESQRKFDPFCIAYLLLEGDTPEMCKILLSRVIHQIPKASQLLLYHVCSLMHKIASNQVVNKMNSSNLAIVLSPNLVKSPQQDIVQLMDDSRLINAAIASIIDDVNFFFNSLSASVILLENCFLFLFRVVK